VRFIRRNNVERFKTLKGVLCSSENLYPFQKDEIESVLGCRVFSHYGQGEHVVLATQCEHSDNYHVIPEYGIMRLIDSKGREIKESGVIGEIMGTGFTNYPMPFVNYRTMDYAVLSDEQCACGRNFPLLERIEGRLQEMLVLKDGRLVTLTPFFAGPDYEPFCNVVDIQFLQEKEGYLVARIVKDVNYSNKDERLLYKSIISKTEGCLEIDFEYLEEIPKTGRGKHNFLIQKLPFNYSAGLLRRGE
jgi:phenylacetate-CoA ligase